MKDDRNDYYDRKASGHKEMAETFVDFLVLVALAVIGGCVYYLGKMVWEALVGGG